MKPTKLILDRSSRAACRAVRNSESDAADTAISDLQYVRDLADIERIELQREAEQDCFFEAMARRAAGRLRDA